MEPNILRNENFATDDLLTLMKSKRSRTVELLIVNAKDLFKD